jgi:hypothetical protein
MALATQVLPKLTTSRRPQSLQIDRQGFACTMSRSSLSVIACGQSVKIKGRTWRKREEYMSASIWEPLIHRVDAFEVSISMKTPSSWISILTYIPCKCFLEHISRTTTVLYRPDHLASLLLSVTRRNRQNDPTASGCYPYRQSRPLLDLPGTSTSAWRLCCPDKDDVFRA